MGKFPFKAGLIVALACLGALGACAGGPGFPERGGSSQGSARVVVGDWDDVDAAVDLACSVSQTAIVSRTIEGAERRYELLVLGDEPGWVVARQIERDQAGADEITLRACLGAYGEPAWEEQFLDATQRRLRELHGRDAAPIRGFGAFDSK